MNYPIRDGDGYGYGDVVWAEIELLAINEKEAIEVSTRLYKTKKRN